LGCRDKELSVLFTDDDRITELNRQYLKRQGPTNVLAFPMGDVRMQEFESAMLGDVVISLDAAMRDSRESLEPVEYTIDRLLIHGVLHLLGYDHEKSEADAIRMETKETILMELMRRK
jgi:probable rRNA maturation factor